MCFLLSCKIALLCYYFFDWKRCSPDIVRTGLQSHQAMIRFVMISIEAGPAQLYCYKMRNKVVKWALYVLYYIDKCLPLIPIKYLNLPAGFKSRRYNNAACKLLLHGGMSNESGDNDPWPLPCLAFKSPFHLRALGPEEKSTFHLGMYY